MFQALVQTASDAQGGGTQLQCCQIMGVHLHNDLGVGHTTL